MPTYEYKREDGTTFEVFQGINDDALSTCPDTGQKVKRVISGGGGVVYKGDGFYVTDYKNKDNKNGRNSQNGTAKSKSDDGGSDSNNSNTKAEKSDTQSTADPKSKDH